MNAATPGNEIGARTGTPWDTAAEALESRVFHVGIEIDGNVIDCVLMDQAEPGAAGEFTAGAVIGGVHNAGHETLFTAMQGNGLSWSWGTFSGGAAVWVTGVIARALFHGYRLASMTATLPAEQILARGVGEISPAILNDIAEGAWAVPGEAEVPPAVALLTAAGIQSGPGTAFAVALRPGSCPLSAVPPGAPGSPGQ
jgi:hypothetical protein